MVILEHLLQLLQDRYESDVHGQTDRQISSMLKGVKTNHELWKVFTERHIQ